MIVEFFDRQERSNPLNAVKIDNAEQLLSVLGGLRNRAPFFCELVGQNGFNLLLGMSESRGCAQYSAADGSPPYLMAVSNEAGYNDEFMEFLTANTSTPVPTRYCLPMERIKKIAAEFVESGERSTIVDWEEI
jgi:hypothetical protein